MDARTILGGAALVLILGGPGSTNGQAPPPVLVSATRFGSLGGPTGSAGELFEQRRDEVADLVDLYGYPDFKKSMWGCFDLQSPWLKKTAVVFCKDVTLYAEPSAITLVIPPRPEAVGFIPLHHGMVSAPNVESDPHNVAIFNAIVARERPPLVKDSDRIELAVVFLHLFRQAPILAADARSSARRARMSILPTGTHGGMVVDDPDGGFTVYLTRRQPGGGVADCFELGFLKSGRLAVVSKTADTDRRP